MKSKTILTLAPLTNHIVHARSLLLIPLPNPAPKAASVMKGNVSLNSDKTRYQGPYPSLKCVSQLMPFASSERYILNASFALHILVCNFVIRCGVSFSLLLPAFPALTPAAFPFFLAFFLAFFEPAKLEENGFRPERYPATGTNRRMLSA
jgi:hypothetical protein